ncbi:uncharacterized protein K452DRAFT_23003 [Aplosporella prunicola CBS 121167]|uniref:Seipin n=1 Tax=Aplosporella prunicola CBS 121167 TaxID=1176127 RepID=A0A6A6AVZ2_9PEZI|nr:uncharacterized protein K452DRAFT_23003 [Aplosporella prunicola CBS 121167]KAF2135408.1 hypothetical protein K452DRAFT_23003 [Aplosporella prunicola CBS 121167]
MASTTNPNSNSYSSDEDDDDRDVDGGVVGKARGGLLVLRDRALAPITLATSKRARRAYVGSALLLLAAIALAVLAAVAYALFYCAYVPVRGVGVDVWLQFSPTQEHHPHGIADIGKKLVSGQAYDVRVALTLPPTTANKEAGNFMLDLALLGPETGTPLMDKVVGAGSESEAAAREKQEPEVLARSRRPAILTFCSPGVELVHKALEMPWYVVGWRREAETLKVGLMEGVVFERGWRNIPVKLRLELQSVERMQVYGVRVEFEARLRGLRYLMYNFRISSFVVFTIAFWSVEMTFTLLAWLALSRFFTLDTTDAPKREKTKIKKEGAIKTEDESADDDEAADDDNLSDTSRTFPSYARQPSLRYSSPRVKKEEAEEEPTPLEAIPTAMEADDEDEDADFVIDEAGRHMDRDSGLGTSMESGVERRESVRRRRSGLFGSGGGR